MAWQEGGEVGRVMSRGPLWAVWKDLMFMKLFPPCRFTHCPAQSAKVAYWGLWYWAPGSTVSAQCFFSLHCVFVPLHCHQLGIVHLFAWGAWQSQWPQLRRQSLMPAPLKALHSFVLKHSVLPIEKYWVGAPWMTLSDGWVRGPDLNSTAGIIQCPSGQTLSAMLRLMILWLSHIGSLVPVGWHCALFYNLLPR